MKTNPKITTFYHSSKNIMINTSNYPTNHYSHRSKKISYNKLPLTAKSMINYIKLPESEQL